MSDLSGSSQGPAVVLASHKVIETARKVSTIEQLHIAGAAVLELDVTWGERIVVAKLEEANQIYGKITNVVNCAGYILEDAVEEASSKEVYDEFNTNVFGAANITRASVPYLRKAAQTGSCHAAIAHFGSLASYWPFPAMAHYCASKAAVSLLTDGIGREVAPFGIKACTIEPGFFRTEFLNMGEAQRRAQTAVTLLTYAGTPVADSRELLIKANNNQAGDPEKGAKVIVDIFTGTGVANGKEIPNRLQLGSDIVGTLKDSIIPEF
ncbi:hypothetical protein M441DRAFT_88438 [Trichoderma asperellum CBS 433.97]|uniref:NAD(P)-binding protein n=1 Tax=Trichoderma asperellum (strain ATCC 204424 / CBS 433.97 / NBRC 101777) TaxID=1042311 RepID=A0A2T3ZFZ2_TRIA4|nr:hypothetical protein M441DRAFT_88438 [Trichoderma asperellum CBS 433.97]PTB43726.1 hypothetical protein M441DRAFT_88438 [Trichoderma asperellum CBS 433.97]